MKTFISRLGILVILIFAVIILNNLSFDYFIPNEKVVYKENIRELTYGLNVEELEAQMDPKIITVVQDGKTNTYLSNAANPVKALVDLGYSISNKNTLISTSPVNELYDYSYVQIKTFTSSIEEIVSNIPYSTVILGTTLCRKISTEEVDQQGVLGVKTATLKKYYDGDDLIAEEVVDEKVVTDPVTEIVILKGPDDSPDDVPQRGYNCTYWWAYVDNINANAEEKQWLKFAMEKESGCNAENDRNSYYKGLYQWDPCLWYKQYPNDNIFNGEAQIEHTLEKLRAGADPNRMWPGIHKLYKAIYGELSWLED